MTLARRIALTGATGFLGTRLLDELAAAGQEVVVVGRRPVGAHPFRMWDAEGEPPALAGVHTVVHAAAHVPARMDTPEEAGRCLQVNALGTLVLLKAARAAGVARFVLISSGNLVERRPGAITDDAYPGRHHTQAPFYLTSKLLAETYVTAMAGPDLRTLIVRPSSIYGPGSTGLLGTVLDRLRRNMPLRIRDGGRHAADYVFVDDVAPLIVRAALSEAQGFLNAGSGIATEVLTVVELVRALVPASTAEIVVDEPVPRQPPPGFSALDVTRARKLFGYRPRSLREGLPRLLA